MESLFGMLLPLGTVVLVVLLQISFWFPADTPKKSKEADIATKERISNNAPSRDNRKNGSSMVSKRINITGFGDDDVSSDVVRCIPIVPSPPLSSRNQSGSGSSEESNGVVSQEKEQQARKVWKCACEFGFIPAGLFKTFGNAEAMMRLGVGQCYHKK